MNLQNNFIKTEILKLEVNVIKNVNGTHFLTFTREVELNHMSWSYYLLEGRYACCTKNGCVQ